MVKGASIKFTSYEDCIPKLLNSLKVASEIKKYEKIILKPTIKNEDYFTSVKFIEEIIKFILKNKNPVSEIFIAEGVDGNDTLEMFETIGYQNIAEKYSIGLIDLNDAETEEIINDEFIKFNSIHYPKVLLESCIITLPILKEDEETEINGSLSNMLGSFPSSHYSGFFSLKKNKIRGWNIKYSIHDILKCKMPNFSIVDASEEGYILAGLPIETDKQATKILGLDWKSISHLKLIEESFSSNEEG